MIVVGVLVVYFGVLIIDVAEGGEHAFAAIGGMAIGLGSWLIYAAGRRAR